MAWEYSQQIRGLPGFFARKSSISETGLYIRLSMSLVSG